jgi:nitroreductase
VDDSAFLRLCRARRSVRKFSSKPVEREKLERCLEAARLAPSADNVQPCRFVVFNDPARRAALVETVCGGVFAPSRWVTKAPVIVCLLIKENLLVNRLGGSAAGTQFQLLDAGIAGEHFALAATEQGLGTCWVGWFDTRACVRHLGLRGSGYRAVALFAVGYPAPDIEPREPRRRPASEISFWNSPPR